MAPSIATPTHLAIPTLAQLLLLADFSLVMLYLIDAGLGHPYPQLAHLVDLDGEANLPTWYSSAQLLVLGLLLGLFIMMTANGRSLRALLRFAPAALCIALSMDEVAQVHELLARKSDVIMPNGTRQGSLFSHTGLWMFLLGPPFLIMVAMVWRDLVVYLQGRRSIARLYIVGFIVYVGSALGIETLSNFVEPGGLAALLQVACEELGEMLGVTLLVWATLSLLTSHDIHLQAGAAPLKKFSD